jgi:hypothetical protein
MVASAWCECVMRWLTAARCSSQEVGTNGSELEAAYRSSVMSAARPAPCFPARGCAWRQLLLRQLPRHSRRCCPLPGVVSLVRSTTVWHRVTIDLKRGGGTPCRAGVGDSGWVQENVRRPLDLVFLPCGWRLRRTIGGGLATWRTAGGRWQFSA